MIQMQKTKIDWCDSTWNPVTGCRHGCEYCYASRIVKRFGGNAMNIPHILDNPFIAKGRTQPYPFGFVPTFHRYRLDDYIGRKGRNIFVCSMADLFGEWVPDSWIEEVFAACDKAPQHNYLFLTKNPKRYTELSDKGILRRTDNMWYGYSKTKNAEPGLSSVFPASKVFVSIEPILEPIDVPLEDWVIIGAETGRRKDKIIPKREWIEDIVDKCRRSGIPVFMKSSLADIWGEPLIQEFPTELRKEGH